jgi:hypothetical protein
LLIKSSNGSFRGDRHCYFVQFLNKYKGMTKKWIVKVTIGIIVTLGAYACQKDGTSISSPLSNVWSLVSSEAPLMEMTYETEITTYQKVLVDRATPNNKFFDLVESQPVVKRQSVLMKLKANGNIYMETTEIAPKNPAPLIEHKSSPDNRKQIKKTIIDNSEMRMYAADGDLLGTSPLQEPMQNIALVEAIQNMKSKTTTAEMANSLSTMHLSTMFSLNLADMEEKANAEGGSVIIEGRIKLIRIPYSNPQSPAQKFMVISVDNIKNLPVFMDITDERGKAFSTISYFYDNINNENPVLKGVKQATYAVSTTGSDIVRYMNVTMSNVNATIH